MHKSTLLTGTSMLCTTTKNHSSKFNLGQQQVTNIVMITFWSQFASYALNTILILFLTRPLLAHGLGYNQAHAYTFMGITQATGYLMPILGGFIADQVLGIRRSILLGSVLLAIAYLLVMLSGTTIDQGDTLFIAAYALLPAANSLLIGTASAMISHIYAENAVKAKSAMTYYYMAINIGGLLATIIAPSLLDSRYGPLAVLTLTFVGKSIAALNFAYRYKIYENVIWGKDKSRLNLLDQCAVVGYLCVLYLFTLFAYSHIYTASILITFGCGFGIVWFLFKTIRLSGKARLKQLVALLLILEAIVFFVIYNQMNSTLVLFAQNNSNLHLFGLRVSPAHYQMLNPILIILLGLQLPKLYQKFPHFSVPYQFACGTLLAGSALLVMAYAAAHANQGIVNGNYIGFTYLLISLAELWVSAIGLSMIGLYCDIRIVGFAMGVWYLAFSLSSIISGYLATWVAIPEGPILPAQSIFTYQQYYLKLGCVAFVLGIGMLIFAVCLNKFLKKHMIIIY